MKKLILITTLIVFWFGSFAQDLTTFDVFDFQVGDEIQVIYSKEDWSRDYPNTVSVTILEEYLEREDYQDSIVYKVAITGDTVKTILVKEPGVQYTDWIQKPVFRDTIRKVIKSTVLDDPGILIDSFYSLRYDKTINKETKVINEVNIFSNDFYEYNFPSNDIFSRVDTIYSFIKGLGGPYYENQCCHFTGASRSLLYYKKGEEIYGEKTITGVFSKSKTGLFIYPNPVINQLIIENKGLQIGQVSIYDIGGTPIKILEMGNEKIDVSDLQRGVYLLQIQTKEGIRQSRFVKE